MVGGSIINCAASAATVASNLSGLLSVNAPNMKPSARAKEKAHRIGAFFGINALYLPHK